MKDPLPKLQGVSEENVEILRVEALYAGKTLGAQIASVRLYSTSSGGVKMVVWADSTDKLYGYGDLGPWEPGPYNVLDGAIEFHPCQTEKMG